MDGMRPPIFIRPLTEDERNRLQAGLRSPDAFVLRRCQILLASARGERAPQIAQAVGCNDQTVRNVLRAFEQTGLSVCLTRQSNRLHRPKTKLDAGARERLKELLHESPRRFGKPTSVWTLELAAEVSFAEGVIPEQVSDEAIRLALKRLGVGWKRAKQWITSPDPAYARKKGGATG
jgi:transposase